MVESDLIQLWPPLGGGGFGNPVRDRPRIEIREQTTLARIRRCRVGRVSGPCRSPCHLPAPAGASLSRTTFSLRLP